MKINLNDFKEIPGYPNYRINVDGDVYSVKRKKLLKVQHGLGKFPYNCVMLSNNGKKTPQSIHKLLALTFIPLPEGYTLDMVLFNKKSQNLVVDHIDGDKFNNDLSNLRWLTAYENANANNHVKKVGAPKGNKNSANTETKKRKFANRPRWIYTYDGIDYNRVEDVAKAIGCSRSKITESFRKNYGLVRMGLLTRR